MSGVFICISVLLLGIVAQGLAQQVGNCDSDEDMSFLFSYTYSNLRSEGEDSRACPPTGPSRGAIVCVPRESPEVTYTLLSSGTNTTGFCVLRNSSRCSGAGAGEFDAIVVIGSFLTSAGSVMIVSGERTEINIDFDLILNSSLRIESDVCLNNSGKVVLNPKVFYGTPPPGFSYKVCKVLDNGTVVSAGQEFSITIDQDPQCKRADSSEIAPLDLSSARVVTLVYNNNELPAQPRTATLFLTTIQESCTETAFRVSENFNVTVINATSCSETVPPIQPPTGTSGLPSEIIGLITVLAVLAVLVVSALAIIVPICWWRRRDRNPPNDDQSESAAKRSNTTLTYSNGHPQPSTSLNLSSQDEGIDDSDSGVVSPPSTPVNVNCTLIVCPNLRDPWYEHLVGTLSGLVKSVPKELTLNTDSLDDFESELHDRLNSDRYHYAFIFQTHGDSQSAYACALHKVLKGLESRPCPSYTKVWVILVGAPEQNALIPSHITRFCVTQAPSKDYSTSEQCAQVIFEEVSKRQPIHPNVRSRTGGETTRGLGATSLDPNSFRHLTDTKGPNGTSSWPMPKKEVPQEAELFRRFVDASERTAEASELIAKSMASVQQNKEGMKTSSESEQRKRVNNSEATQQAKESSEDLKTISESLGQIQGTLVDVSSRVRNTEAMLENQVVKQDQETIDEPPLPSDA